MSERYLTTRQVADLLAVNPETVLRWYRSGRLPGGKRLNGSNCLRFRESVLEEWLAGDLTERHFFATSLQDTLRGGNGAG